MKKLAVLFIVFYLFYVFFIQLLFADNDLISIKGNVVEQYTFVKTENWEQQRIRLSYLTFLLRGDQKIYTLKVNAMDAADESRIFQGVYLALKESREVEVWIKKGELSNPGPRVYQIVADEQNIFEMKNKPNNGSRQLYGYLFILFLSFYLIYYLLFLATDHHEKAQLRGKWAFHVI